MTVIAGERHEDHDRETHGAQPRVPAGDPLSELAREPSVDEAVKVVAANPGRRDQIMVALQQRMGNAFVQRVIVSLTARPAPNALPLSIHPPGQSKADAIIQDNAAALDKGRRLGDLGSKHLTEITSLLIPAYGKARDQLDVRGVTELGGSLVASLQLARASTSALADQLALVKTQSQVGMDIAIEGAEAGEDASLHSQLAINRGLISTIELAVLHTLAPLMFRGVAVAPGAAPVMKDEASLDPMLEDELTRTIVAMAFVVRTRKQVLATIGRQSASVAQQARMELAMTFHRPLDLEFVRAALTASGVWDALNAADPMMPGTAKATGPLAFETCTDAGPATDLVKQGERQAKRTGWMTDTGTFDTEMMRSEIRTGNTESALTVYTMITSADGEARVKLLDQIDREGLLDVWLANLPWHYTKELHDSLPHGNGPIKHRLQKWFKVEGKWGTDLAEEEYHAPSLTKMIRNGGEHLGSVGSSIVNGLDDVLNVATLGFHHSYGEAHDDHAEGMITDDDYRSQVNQIATRTTVGMALMMATGGLGEALPGLEAGASVTRTMVAGGVEAGTFATAEVMAMDATDVATGAKDQMGSTLDYLKVYALSGVMGAGMGGATAALSGRTAAKYLPKAQMTRGQRLAVENPRLANVIDQVGPVAKGGVAEIRIHSADIGGLEQRGVIDAASAQKLRAVTADGGTARATVRVTDELNQPGLVSDGAAFEVTDAKADTAARMKTSRIAHDGEEGEVAPDAARAKLGNSKDIEFTTDTKHLPNPTTKEQFGVPVGRRLATAAEGHTILDQLAAGDSAALEALGVKVRWRFKPDSREWSLVETSDGYVVYAGGATSVSTPAEFKVIGHTHPARIGDKELALTHEPGAAPTFEEIEQTPRSLNAHGSGLMPSPMDVEVIGEGGEQILHTKYKMKDGKIVSPDAVDAEGQINITISSVKKLSAKNADVHYYEAKLTARAGGDQPVWTKTAYFKHWVNRNGSLDRMYFELPAEERAMLSALP